jgi:hypothetical protein
VAPDCRLTDQISIGVLAYAVPRDAVENAITRTGRQARRSNGKLPPHVVVYLVMAMALFTDASYEEVASKLLDALAVRRRGPAALPTSGGITQARQRLGSEPLELLFREVARPVATSATRGSFVRDWRLMTVDGFELEVPGTEANSASFKGPADGDEPALPRVRMLTIAERGSGAKVAARIGLERRETGWQSLAHSLCQRLDPGWLVIADQDLWSWPAWRAACATGAALLWRTASDLRLPVLWPLPDGSYISVLVDPAIRSAAQTQIIRIARAGGNLDAARAALVRVIEYELPGSARELNDELIALVTTITNPFEASATELAQAYQQWLDDQAAQRLRGASFLGPATALRSRSPEMIRQEIYGCLLTSYALSAMNYAAAAAARIEPDQGVSTQVRIVRRPVTGLAEHDRADGRQ